MQDLSGMLKQWRKDKSNESKHHANDPLVSPFHPYILPEDEETDNGDKEPESTSKQKSKKTPLVRYTFTDLTYQAHEMAVDLRDDTNSELSITLASAFDKLQKSRAKRNGALKAFDVKILDAVSQCLYELGPAPQQDGHYQVQRQSSLHRRMKSLRVSGDILNVSLWRELSSIFLVFHLVDSQRSGIYEVSQPDSHVKQPSTSNKKFSGAGPLPRKNPQDASHSRGSSLPGPSIDNLSHSFSLQNANRQGNWESNTPGTTSMYDGTLTHVQSTTVSKRDVYP